MLLTLEVDTGKEEMCVCKIKLCKLFHQANAIQKPSLRFWGQSPVTTGLKEDADSGL